MLPPRLPAAPTLHPEEVAMSGVMQFDEAAARRLEAVYLAA
jgi:hypothetical protein